MTRKPIALSKKELHNTAEDRKLGMLPNSVRDARRHKHLAPKPLGYDLIYKPSTHEELVTIANELMQWAELPESNNINDFALSKKISPYRFKRLNNEYFQECLERVKYYIASKNRSALIGQKFNEKLYFQELPLLDRDVKEYQEEQVARKLELTSGSAVPTKIVVIDSMLQVKEIEKAKDE